MSAYVVVQLVHSGNRHAADDKTRFLAALKRAPVKRLMAECEAVRLNSDNVETGEAAGTATFAVPDMARANKLAAALRGMAGVEAAYSKPAEEMP